MLKEEILIDSCQDKTSWYVDYHSWHIEGDRILKKNGTVISKTLLSTDTYSPKNKIVRVGTKKVTNNKTTTTQNKDIKIENKTEQ